MTPYQFGWMWATTNNAEVLSDDNLGRWSFAAWNSFAPNRSIGQIMAFCWGIADYLNVYKDTP